MYHGMLTVYKERGYTSSDAVARLRGILHMRRIGHTGTLDPDAEGVLPMCLGSATRICELIADREKEYLAVMRLGVRTDTQDMSGTVLSEMEPSRVTEVLCGHPASDGGSAPSLPEKEGPQGQDDGKTGRQEEGLQGQADRKDPGTALPRQQRGAAEERIRAAAARFVGEIDQVPPMYSAIKVNGKRLYDLARKGETVERKARRITIYALDIEKVELPLVTMRVRCSKGTYIRTLCEDLGAALGTGAAMQSLLRTRVGQFSLGEARTLDEIERIAKAEDPEALEALIRPVDSFFSFLPAAVVRANALRLLRNGNPLGPDELRTAPGGNGPDGRALMPGGPGSGEAVGGDGAAPRDRKASLNSAGSAPPLLPGAGPRDQIVRVYDEAGLFYGLYRRAQGQRRYTAFKMFLPEAPR